MCRTNHQLGQIIFYVYFGDLCSLVKFEKNHPIGDFLLYSIIIAKCHHRGNTVTLNIDVFFNYFLL